MRQSLLYIDGGLMRIEDEQLLAFCVKQKECFTLADWHSYQDVELTKIAALILYGSTWYGRKSELHNLCETWQLQPESLPERIKLSKFDIARFSSMLKKKLSFL